MPHLCQLWPLGSRLPRTASEPGRTRRSKTSRSTQFNREHGYKSTPGGKPVPRQCSYDFNSEKNFQRPHILNEFIEFTCENGWNYFVYYLTSSATSSWRSDGFNMWFNSEVDIDGEGTLFNGGVRDLQHDGCVRVIFEEVYDDDFPEVIVLDSGSDVSLLPRRSEQIRATMIASMIVKAMR